MYRALVFAIAAGFCACLAVTAAIETSENAALQNQSDVGYGTENRQIYQRGSEMDALPEEECECKNGTCVRQCDVDKTKQCDDKMKICVCNQEFGKKGPNECAYCDCGIGFGCTWEKSALWDWRKTCSCPKGYMNDGYRCRKTCSFAQPCRNEGSCYSYRCFCRPGTRGDLCEEIDECRKQCRNRLEVDCVYAPEQQGYHCRCKNSSLFYDYSTETCKPCSCGNGKCVYDYHKLKCECDPGYRSYNGYCKKCDCGFDSECDINYLGQQSCECPDGFFERDGHCRPCHCKYHGDKYTECSMVRNAKRCFCGKGFKDVDGFCEDIDECEEDNPCHASAKCYNSVGEFACMCPSGYKGLDGSEGGSVEPGEACEDINECQEKQRPCGYRENTQCVNLPGSFKCICLPGFEPASHDVDPYETKCVTATKSWGPAAIVIFTSVGLVVVGSLMCRHVRSKALHSN